MELKRKCVNMHELELLKIILQSQIAMLALVGLFVVLKLNWFREDYRGNYGVAMGAGLSAEDRGKCDELVANDKYSDIAEELEKFSGKLRESANKLTGSLKDGTEEAEEATEKATNVSNAVNCLKD